MTPKKKTKTKTRRSAKAVEGTWEAATAPHIEELTRRLHELYPDADCELDWESPLQLLLSTILSAQSTDVRVNEVGKTLYKKYPTVEDFANADREELEQDIRSTGFYRNKTKSLMGATQRLIEHHDGEVPQTIEELVKLPGVARKTANVVLGTAFGIPSGFVVDTHIKRLAYRLGLTQQTDPVKVERDLMERIPKDEWIFGGHAIILHGRRVCHAKKPNCSECKLAELCPRNGLPLEG